MPLVSPRLPIHHRLHVDRCTEHVVDVVDAAIVLGTIILPRAEHGIAGHHELFAWILREVTLGVLFYDLLVFGDYFLQGLGVEIGIELRFLLFLLGIEDFIKDRFFDVEHDVAEHLDQAPVGVRGEAWIVAALGEGFDAIVVEAEVQNRVHHAGHGELRARAHTHEQRILARAQLLSLQRLQLSQRFVHLPIDVGR